MGDTINTFEQRLKKYRENKELLKYEFAKKLDVSESFYNMIENGRKNPSKNFLSKLVAESKKPEEFWLYGVEENKYTNIKESEGLFIVVHAQRDSKNDRNYIEYVCNTPREVLLLVTTLKTFASPIKINNYLIYYRDGENEVNYSLEEIEKIVAERREQLRSLD